MTPCARPIVYRWKLTGLQFKVLCDDLRLGGLPRPFTFTSNTRFADDYERERDEVRAGLREVTDPRFDAMVRALTRPDIMVLANLWNERHHTDPRQCIRVHAVRRDERGYVITQRPGETVAHRTASISPNAIPRTWRGRWSVCFPKSARAAIRSRCRPGAPSRARARIPARSGLPARHRSRPARMPGS
ncbi:ESX secretion-associated protein EspG [Nocardia testacea]|uniref:ESX secretion-associated protein EspG n=1 Tax=Nocardia testacea TaxID=248551 RepID=UPI003A83821C